MLTRWNSFLPMLESGLKMKDAFASVYSMKTELKWAKKWPSLPTDSEWDTLGDLPEALMPVCALSEKLCKENVTLLQADNYFRRAKIYLSANTGWFAQNLDEAIQNR